jgi:5-methylcytosine-specific restriction endonuclease McrA
MVSETYRQLKREALERKGKNSLSKKEVIMLEIQMRKDLPQVCAQCGRTEYLTLDHIIPLQILRDLGIDVEKEVIDDNYQILCRICNNFKSNRIDIRIPKTKDILLRILNGSPLTDNVGGGTN